MPAHKETIERAENSSILPLVSLLTIDQIKISLI